MTLTTDPSPTVSDALETRITVRSFLDMPVPTETLHAIFETARRAPSGGNLQPWNVHVLAGDKLKALVADGLEKGMSGQMEAPTHPAYPSPLWEPLRSWRYKLGEDMYGLLGIEKDNKLGRMAQFMENMKFFNAPVGIIITGDKRLGMPQHMDIGIYIQTLMLLAREHGLHTAPQGWWRNWPDTVKAHVPYPDDQEVLVGMSMGYANPETNVNNLRADRAALSERVTFYED